MVLDLTPEQEASVTYAAELGGLSVAALLAELAEGVARKEQEEDAILNERLEDADRGDFLSREEAELRFQTMLRR